MTTLRPMRIRIHASGSVGIAARSPSTRATGDNLPPQRQAPASAAAPALLPSQYTPYPIQPPSH